MHQKQGPDLQDVHHVQLTPSVHAGPSPRATSSLFLVCSVRRLDPIGAASAVPPRLPFDFQKAFGLVGLNASLSDRPVPGPLGRGCTQQECEPIGNGVCQGRERREQISLFSRLEFELKSRSLTSHAMIFSFTRGKREPTPMMMITTK